jgi:hypothetical protein
MEEEKKIEVEEVSTNPEDWEGQTTFEVNDIREFEEIDGGDLVETTENVAE